MRSGLPALCALLLAVAIALLGFCAAATAATYNGFSTPQPVLLQGYSGSAMEPFITPDGRYLLFNTSNVAPNIPTLQVASRVDGATFEYLGEIEGSEVNEPGALSGTPSLDRESTLYFISTRSYNETLLDRLLRSVLRRPRERSAPGLRAESRNARTGRLRRVRQPGRIAAVRERRRLPLGLGTDEREHPHVRSQR